MGETTKVQVPIEVVEWHDASKTFRERYQPGRLVLITVGFVLYEDKNEIVLFHEIQKSVGYASGNVDATSIPKKGVLARTATGVYAFVPNALVKQAKGVRRHGKQTANPSDEGGEGKASPRRRPRDGGAADPGGSPGSAGVGDGRGVPPAAPTQVD